MTSLHSSGRDSGLDLTRSDSPSKHLMVRTLRGNGVGGASAASASAELIGGSRRKKCSCGGHAEQHLACRSDDSRFLYIKNDAPEFG